MKPRLLVFELRMMGDAIMSLPFIRAAREKYEIFACCQPSVGDVFRLVLPPEQIVPWRPPWLDEESKYGLAKWKNAGLGKLLRRIRAIRPQIALSVWADARIHLLTALSGARERIGFPMAERNFYASELPWRRKQLRIGQVLNLVGTISLCRKLVTKKINRNDYLQHHVEDWRQLAEALDLTWNTDTPWFSAPSTPLPADILDRVRTARAQRQQLWLLHPGARSPSHRWPVEKFRALIEQTFAPNRIPLIVIDPAESPLPPNWSPGIPTCRPGSLAEFFRLVSEVDCVICNDTGVAHVADALGKRVVSVFGAGFPRWFAPYHSLDRVAQSDVCPHRPCFERCVMPSFICLEGVTVEAVKRQIERLCPPMPRPSGSQPG